MSRSSYADAGHLSKAMVLIDLVRETEVRANGLSIADIELFVGCSRRTAERYRDALMTLYPDFQERIEDNGVKRWIWRHHAALPPVDIRAEELADLQLAAQQAGVAGAGYKKGNLESLSRKIASSLRSNARRRLEPDLEALLLAEGFASGPRPRQKIDSELAHALRHAILSTRKVEFHYWSRITGDTTHRTVEPYGFLVGSRHYLIARESAANTAGTYKLFSLSNIKDLALLEIPFEIDDNFNIQDFAAFSFGVWRDDTLYDIDLRFTSDVATDALAFSFHPSQKVSQLDDGSVQVLLKCSGLNELCHHLFTWGSKVTIQSPQKLKELMREQVESSRSVLV